ncbi:MAG: hypothetical protein HQL14_05630 [Candidatus Omnitrophica bacterium]|nr:hypothetical protein [Candidatus Omnitrophota bacterium]
MKNILFVLFLLFNCPVSWATPPTSITQTYDLDKASLHVDAVHPSDLLDKSYVRMMTVSLNNKPVQTFYYYRQKDHAGFSEDVSLKAKVGDVIKVDLFCTQGGSLSDELTVPAPDKK